MSAALRFAPGQPAAAVADLPPEPGGGIWCDLGGADPGAAAPWLARLHPLTAAALGDDRRQLAAAQPAYVHVRLAGGAGAPSSCDVVLGAGFVLSRGVRDLPPGAALWADYACGRRRADTPHFGVYQALTVVVAGYRRAGLALLGVAEGVTQRLVHLSERGILHEIVDVRRRALHLRAAVAPAVDALRLLADAEQLPAELRPYFSDLCRQAEEVLHGVEGVRETMGEAVEAYTSVQSTEMNRVMQLFTVLAALFGPPTLIASIYGMNFRVPEYRWPFGYWWALGLMVVVTGSIFFYLRRRGWL